MRGLFFGIVADEYAAVFADLTGDGVDTDTSAGPDSLGIGIPVSVALCRIQSNESSHNLCLR